MCFNRGMLYGPDDKPIPQFQESIAAMEILKRTMDDFAAQFSPFSQSRLVDERGNYLQTTGEKIGTVVHMRRPPSYRFADPDTYARLKTK